MSNNATAMENLITSMGNSLLIPEGEDEIAYSFLGMKDSVSYFKFWKEVVEKSKLSVDGQVLLIRLAIVRKSRPRLMRYVEGQAKEDKKGMAELYTFLQEYTSQYTKPSRGRTCMGPERA